METKQDRYGRTIVTTQTVPGQVVYSVFDAAPDGALGELVLIKGFKADVPWSVVIASIESMQPAGWVEPTEPAQDAP